METFAVALLGLAVLWALSGSSDQPALLDPRQVRGAGPQAHAPAPGAAAEKVRVVVQQRAAAPKPSSTATTAKAAPTSSPTKTAPAPVAPDPLKTLGQTGVNAIAPALPGTVGRAAGNVLTATGEQATFFGAHAAGGLLKDVGAAASGFSAPLVGIFGSKLVGLRGASEKEQKKIFGAASVDTAATALGAVPFVGTALGGVLKIAAGTYEGKRAVKAVGTAELQAYDFQKDILTGHISEAFGGGQRKERVGKLLAAARAATPQTMANSAMLKAQDAAARGLYTGPDKSLQAESSKQAEALRENQRRSDEFNAQQEANKRAAEDANRKLVEDVRAGRIVVTKLDNDLARFNADFGQERVRPVAARLTALNQDAAAFDTDIFRRIQEARRANAIYRVAPLEAERESKRAWFAEQAREIQDELAALERERVEKVDQMRRAAAA